MILIISEIDVKKKKKQYDLYHIWNQDDIKNQFGRYQRTSHQIMTFY